MKSRMVRVLAGLSAIAVVAGSFVGLPATVASAATSPFTMTMTAGQFGVRGNPPATLPAPGSLAGSEDRTTGAISGATISLSPYHTTNTGSTETIFIGQVTAGTASGLLSYTGTLRITDTLSALVTIHSPVSEQCLSEPIHVNLTGHYDSTTQTATISQTNFTIPNFPTTTPGKTCGLANTELNTRFAGSTGNVMSLTLQGTLVLPPPPATPTSTTLVPTPPSPVLQGTSVTLTATVVSGGQTAKIATGTIKFMVGGTQIGATQSVVTGTASLTTTTLPPVTGQTLTAVYSGDAKFGASTSTPAPYTVQPKPAVGLSTTALTAMTGSSTPTTFSVVLTNPTTGESWSNLWLQLRWNGISGLHSTRVTLAYQNPTDVWCPVTVTGSKVLTAIFKGSSGTCSSTSSFPLPANGQPMVIPFEVSYAAGANVGALTFVVSLQTVTGTTVVPPFTTATTTTIPTHGPYAKGTLTVVPPTKLTVTVAASPPGSAIPKGYVVPVDPTITRPPLTTTNTIFYQEATGTVTFIVDGHTVLTAPALSTAFTHAQMPTATLSLGSHTLEVKYQGNSIYNPAQFTTTFSVTTPVPGTPFSCSNSRQPTIVASVVASGTLPVASNTGQAALGNLGVTLHSDPATGPGTPTTLTTVIIAFSPSGSLVAPSVMPTPTGVGRVITSSWNGLGTTVTTVTGPPGTVVPVTISSISFRQTGELFICSPNPTAASLGSVTVSGVALAGSPASPVSAGTSVTLTATVAPASLNGQVNFFEVHGTTTTNLGTVPVSNGTAALVVQPTAGSHTYEASWAATVPVSTSNTLAYTVSVAPAVTTQPADQSVTAGQAASFSAAASGTPTPTVQWQLSTNGSIWSTITGATGTTYAIASTTAADNGHQFRAVFTNGAGTATTNAASLVVSSPPAVVTQPFNQSVPVGNTATFASTATGSPTPTVQWQLSTDGSTWTTITGATATTYTTPPTTTANNGNQFRAVFTNGIGTANSNPATLSVATTPPPPAPPAPPTPPANTSGGYHLVASNGSVYSYGNAPFYGSMGGQTLNKPIVGTASTPGDGGYWLVGSDGGIFSFGNAIFYGSMGGKPLNQPIVGIASTPDGKGYWEVASDGGIFAFGDATFFGSMGAKPLNQPIVGIAATPDGQGYWEVASDGGIFAFGDATFAGSTGSLTLNKPIVGMASTNNGAGYWLVASDGGVFSFGNAGFHGTVAGTTTSQIVSLVPTGDNGGYWETASNGQVFQFGDATSAGTALAQTATIVAMSD